jgi:hypothetical protein
MIVADDPVMRAVYPEDKDLLVKADWKQSKGMVNEGKKMLQQVHQVVSQFHGESTPASHFPSAMQLDVMTLSFLGVREQIPHGIPSYSSEVLASPMCAEQDILQCVCLWKSDTADLHNKQEGFTLDWYCKKQVTVETATFGSEFPCTDQTCVEQDILHLRTPLWYLGGHDMITGRAVTGILDFVNATPLNWHCKRQATVETATYSSELVVSRTCVEQDIDLRTLLRYLGVQTYTKVKAADLLEVQEE